MARNNKLKMSKHKGKGITAIGKKSIFKDQFVWKVLLSVLEYTKAIPKLTFILKKKIIKTLIIAKILVWSDFH